MRYLISIALLIQLLVPHNVGSEAPAQLPTEATVELTGNEFLRQCTYAIRFADGERDLTAGESEYGTYCMGYLRGFYEGYSAKAAANRVLGDAQHREVCFPDSLPTDQAVRIVVKYLREHPERLQQAANLLVLQAFYAAFPCK